MWFPFRSRSNCDFYDFHVESKILCNLSARKSLNFSNFRMFIQFFSFGDRRGKLYLGMNIFIVVSLVRLTIIFYYSLSRITNGEFHSLYDTELTRSLWCSFVYEAVRAIWPNFDHIYIENSFSRRRRMSRRGERSIDRVSSRAFVMQPHSAKRVANRLTRDTCIIYMERGMEYLFGNARFQRFEFVFIVRGTYELKYN